MSNIAVSGIFTRVMFSNDKCINRYELPPFAAIYQDGFPIES